MKHIRISPIQVRQESDLDQAKSPFDFRWQNPHFILGGAESPFYFG